MSTDPEGDANSVCFDISEETRLILESLDSFIEKEVEPIEDTLGETWSNPRLRHRSDGRFVDEVLEAIETVRKKSAEAGFYAMNIPERAGGEGVETVTWYRAQKHVSTHGTGLTKYVLAGPEGPKPMLVQAEGEQIDKYLTPVVNGEKSTAFAQTEPGVGSDSPNMKTSATREGDGWVLNGRKQWITNAPYADFVQVLARTTPKKTAGRHDGITCFIVEDDEFEVGALNNAVGSVGMQSEVYFDNVYLPDDRVLGTVDDAFYDAMDFLSVGRLEVGARAVGLAQNLITTTVDYANTREAFGQSIGKFQGISHKLARGRAKTFAADSAGLRLAWQMDEGWETIEESSVFKWFATNTFDQVADDVVQIHGANGLAENNPYMDHLHRARIFRIVEGTDEIQLNSIAKQLGVY